MPDESARLRDTKCRPMAVVPTRAQGHVQGVPQLSTGSSTAVETALRHGMDGRRGGPITSDVNEAPDTGGDSQGKARILRSGASLCSTCSAADP